MQYRQDKQYYEDDYGMVTLTFIIADTYEELFAEADYYVSIFHVQETSESLDTGSIQREAELKFKINEVTVVSTVDQDALSFTLEAADNITRRYCATFINTGTTPDVEDMDFSGLVRPDLKASDLQWYNNEFTDAPTPLREWEFRALPYTTQIFDEIPLKDIIAGNDEDEDVVSIDSSWETTNVGDRPGWAKFDRGGDTAYYQTRHSKLVNLNKLLNKLAENIALTLQNKGHGLLSVNFAVTQMDYRLSPARFCTVLWNSPSIRGRYVRSQNSQDHPSGSYWIEADDARVVKFGTTDDYLSPHIAYSLVKPGGSAEALQQKNYLLYERCKTFTDLLYAVAVNFGAFLRFDYLATDSLRISFLPRSTVGLESVYVRGVTQAELTTKPLDLKESFYGEANALAAEGDDGYVVSRSGDSFTKSIKMKDRSGTKLLLTISPTTRKGEGATDPNFFWLWPHLPHNSYLLDGSAIRNASFGSGMVDATGVTTAIYLNVPKSSEPGYSSGEYLFAPAAALSVTVDGTLKTFNTMSDFLNFTAGRDVASFETEYNLTAPFICSFRRSADGTHGGDDGGRGSWRNLRLGRKITLDGIDYAIVGIRRSYEKVETAIQLNRIGRFTAFEDASGVPSALMFGGGVNPSEGDSPAVPSSGWLTLITGEELSAGRLAVVDADGKVYYALAHHAHYGLVKGITAHAADEDAPITLIPLGYYTNNAYNFTPGARLYLRTESGGALNISETPLSNSTETEDLFCSIGYAITPTTIHINVGSEFIYQPQAEEL